MSAQDNGGPAFPHALDHLPLKKRRAAMTQEILKRELTYDPETGIFTRVRKTGARVEVGDTAGSRTHPDGYSLIRVCGVAFKAHRLAWLYVHGEWPAGVIDHINRDRTDNRISNLRDVTANENAQNTIKARPSNKSGLIGVKVRPYGGFQARIQAGGRKLHLGTYKSAEEAHEAYMFAKRRLHVESTYE